MTPILPTMNDDADIQPADAANLQLPILPTTTTTTLMNPLFEVPLQEMEMTTVQIHAAPSRGQEARTLQPPILPVQIEFEREMEIMSTSEDMETFL